MKKFNPMWIVWACIGSWVLFLLNVGSASIGYSDFETMTSGNPELYIVNVLITIASVLTIPTLYILYKGFTNKSLKDSDLKPDSTQKKKLRKGLAATTLAALAISTYAAITSYGIDVADTARNKFVYENVGTAFCIVAIVLILILNALLSDLYWVSRNKKLKLDERQIKDRQEVFEKSYKIGAWVSLFSFYLIYANYHENLAPIANSFGAGQFVPLFNLAFFLFALPLVIAAWKKK